MLAEVGSWPPTSNGLSKQRFLMDEDAGRSNYDTEVVLTTPSLAHSLKDVLAMRTDLARSIVAAVVLSIICGCSSGRGKSLSMASMNPFKPSSKALADSNAPLYEKPSDSANSADSLPPAPKYASTSGGLAASSKTYPEKAAAFSGPDRMAQPGYQDSRSPYASTTPKSSPGNNALSSSPPAVSPQQGYYGSGDYRTASRSNSPASGYSYGGASRPPAGTGTSPSCSGTSCDLASRDRASAGSYASPRSQTDSGSRYATGAERWGTGSSAASGYNYPKSSSVESNPRYPSSNGPASPWSTTAPAVAGSTPNGASPYGSSTGSYTAAPLADRYGSNKGYLSDSTPSSSFRDRQASAYTGQSSSAGNYNYGSTGSSPLAQPAPTPPERAAYVPGQNNYAPGNTGYNPPATPSYQSPAGNYTTPDPTGTGRSGYSPGSIDRYRTDSTGGSSPTGSYPAASGSQSNSPYGYKLPVNG